MTVKKQITILVLLCIIFAACFFLVKQCHTPKPDIIAAVDSVQYWKNKFGQENASIKQREQDYYKATKGYIDSIAKLHNTNAGLIKEILSWQMKGSVVITEPGKPVIKYKRDTVQGECPVIDYAEQHFTDPYYNALVTIPLNNDFASILTLQTFDTLRAVTKIVKEGGLFNRRQYLQVDVVNTNPYSKITGLQVYRQPLPKQKRFGIGLQAGYGFGNDLKPTIFIGAGISYNLIRL